MGKTLAIQERYSDSDTMVTSASRPCDICGRPSCILTQRQHERNTPNTPNTPNTQRDITINTFYEYQSATVQTAIYPGAGTGSADAIIYTILGLLGETGEIANKWKKYLRNDFNVSRDNVRADVISELGDVLWYAARLADEFDVDLGDIARRNIDKLADRKLRGKLSGNGDNR